MDPAAPAARTFQAQTTLTTMVAARGKHGPSQRVLSGVARLYDGPDGTGSLLGEETLDMHQNWYTRFMIYSGTSGGQPVVGGSLNVYSFSITVPEPSAFVLLGIGAVSLLGYAWRRRKQTA